MGYAIGAVSYFAGIIVSAVLDFPTGAVIVWAMAVVAVVAGTWIGKRTSLGLSPDAW